MKLNYNIDNLNDLKKVVDVVPYYATPKTKYMVDYNSNYDVIIRTYVNGEEDEDSRIEAELWIANNFEELFEEIKGYLPENAKFSISEDYAEVLLSIFNGGESEDYEED